MPDKMFQKLNEQQKRFCENYLTYFQPKKAAREAGFNEDYSYALLRNPLIKGYIKERSANIMAEIHQEQVRVFRELCVLAFSDIRQLYDEEGNIKPLNEWPDEVARCVASVKQTVRKRGKGENRIVEKSLEPKLWNKNQALDTLARVVGLLTSEVNVNLPENSGSIYFPAPKEVGAPVDPAIIAQDRKLKLLQGEKDRDKEDETK